MIDLHLHLDGSLRPGTVREILNKQGITHWENEAKACEALCVMDDCRDLNDYLSKFEYPCMALKTPENIERAFFELGEDLATQGLEYAEIRFAPQLSTGIINEEEAVQAAIRGVKKAESAYDIRLGIILCCMRGTEHEHNLLTVEAAKKYLGSHVCALDLAGAEALYSTDKFEKEFKLAKKYDIPFTIHAGEASGAESIWKALEFGASRIGHGIRCVEDGALVDYLARYEIPLEVCPTSNMQTKVFSDIKIYPIKELLLNGVRVTLNTDNMTVSNTCLEDERTFVKKYCQITDEDIELMEQYSRKAAFLL